MEEVLYKAIYDLRHKATQTGFSTNFNTARQKSFPKSHFSFVIKQRGNSWKLSWVNSTILNNKILLILISYVVFMFLCQFYWLLFMKKLFILLFHQFESDGSENIDSLSGGLYVTSARSSWFTDGKQGTLTLFSCLVKPLYEQFFDWNRYVGISLCRFWRENVKISSEQLFSLEKWR